MKYPTEIEEAIKKLKDSAQELKKVKRYKKRRKQFQRASKEKLKRLAPHFLLYLVSGNEKHLEKLKALQELYEDYKDVIAEDDESLYVLVLFRQLREFHTLLQERVKASAIRVLEELRKGKDGQGFDV